MDLLQNFRLLLEAELERAARELMDASDYLTESVQRFTLNGDMKYLEQYFTEAFESNRREEATREKKPAKIKKN